MREADQGGAGGNGWTLGIGVKTHRDVHLDTASRGGVTSLLQ